MRVVHLDGSGNHPRAVTPLIDTGRRSMRGSLEYATVSQTIKHLDGDLVVWTSRVPLDQLRPYDETKHGTFKPFDGK